jgi:hypothetical protein
MGGKRKVGGILSVSTQEKVLKRYRNKKQNLIPQGGTFPINGIGRTEPVERQRKKISAYHLDFVIRFKNKERWTELKKTLGEQYLNELRKQCCYKIAA